MAGREPVLLGHETSARARLSGRSRPKSDAGSALRHQLRRAGMIVFRDTCRDTKPRLWAVLEVAAGTGCEESSQVEGSFGVLHELYTRAVAGSIPAAPTTSTGVLRHLVLLTPSVRSAGFDVVCTRVLPHWTVGRPPAGYSTELSTSATFVAVSLADPGFCPVTRFPSTTA